MHETVRTIVEAVDVLSTQLKKAVQEDNHST